MNGITTGLAAFGATGLELAEAAVVVLVVMTRGHRRAALLGAATSGVLVVAAAITLGPRVLGLVPLDRLRQLLGAGLLVLGTFWLLQALIRPQAPAQELAKERAGAARAARRGAVASAAVTAKAVAVEGTEAAVLVVAIGSPAHQLTAAGVGAAIAALVVAVLSWQLMGPFERIATTTLNRVAGTVLAVIGAFWLADGSHLGPVPATALVTAAGVLAAASWRGRRPPATPPAG